MRPLRFRRDPAPSRLRYRLSRLWLTPSFRRVLRVGPPLLVLLLAALWVATDAATRARIGEFYTDMVTSIDDREEFRVTAAQVTGASYGLRQRLEAEAGKDLPASSLRLNLAEMRARLEAYPAVARASVRLVPGGKLHVDITERRPVALWRRGDELLVLDAEGITLRAVENREAKPMLPLILGDGADGFVAEGLAIIAGAAPIHARIRGLERIGSRRWDLVLDRDQTIMLPEVNPVAALRRVMALHSTEDLLSRDIVAVDMRNPTTPVLRVGAVAMRELRLNRMQN